MYSIWCVFVIAAEYNWEVDTWQTKYFHQTTRQVGSWSRPQQLQYCSLSSECRARAMQSLYKEHDLRMWCLYDEYIMHPVNCYKKFHEPNSLN